MLPEIRPLDCRDDSWRDGYRRRHRPEERIQKVTDESITNERRPDDSSQRRNSRKREGDPLDERGEKRHARGTKVRELHWDTEPRNEHHEFSFARPISRAEDRFPVLSSERNATGRQHGISRTDGRSERESSHRRGHDADLNRGRHDRWEADRDHTNSADRSRDVSRHNRSSVGERSDKYRPRSSEQRREVERRYDRETRRT